MTSLNISRFLLYILSNNMKNTFNVLVLFLLGITLNSCSSAVWTAHPDIVEHKMCDRYSGDPLQMIYVPGYGDTVIVVEDCEQFPRQKVAIALQNFELAWQAYFGRERSVIVNLSELVITFSSMERMGIGHTASGDFVENGRIDGYTSSKSSVWVYTPPGAMRICESSLIHELVHASLWARNGHGDPDHTGTRFSGWTYRHDAMIDAVNRHLCVLGI